jgi:hypothetical protein
MNVNLHIQFCCTAVDTAKTVLQIDNVEGFRSLMRRVKAGRIGVLYSGAFANAISAILGHYPWVRFGHEICYKRTTMLFFHLSDAYSLL